MYKVILDCDLMRYPNSGLYYYCLNLGNHIQRALSAKQQDILFYAPSSAAKVFNSPANCISERKYHKLYKPFLKNCRIWHAPFQSGRILPDKNKFRNIKVVLTIHDLNALHEGKPLKEQKISIAHTQKLIDKSDAIVCISEFTKNDVLQHCDTKGKPLQVIHNGVHKVRESNELDSSYRPVKPFLFAMGYVNRKKNFHVLLSLIKSSQTELVIAGRLDEPDYVSKIMEEAKLLGIEDSVHLLGPVSENDKAWYLHNCLAFVHPSLAEGFGAPVVEAMAIGKPLFLSDKTSLPEIGGDAAFYFSSFHPDHMQKVFYAGMEQYNMNGMAKRIKARAEQFSWERSAEQYINVYHSLF